MLGRDLPTTGTVKYKHSSYMYKNNVHAHVHTVMSNYNIRTINTKMVLFYFSVLRQQYSSNCESVCHNFLRYDV